MVSITNIIIAITINQWAGIIINPITALTTFFENPYARQNIDEGYLTLQVESGGADSTRQIGLRTKPSTGEWFLWEQFILSDIRPPKSADPWA